MCTVSQIVVDSEGGDTGTANTHRRGERVPRLHTVAAPDVAPDAHGGGQTDAAPRRWDRGCYLNRHPQSHPSFVLDLVPPGLRPRTRRRPRPPASHSHPRSHSPAPPLNAAVPEAMTWRVSGAAGRVVSAFEYEMYERRAGGVTHSLESCCTDSRDTRRRSSLRWREGRVGQPASAALALVCDGSSRSFRSTGTLRKGVTSSSTSLKRQRPPSDSGVGYLYARSYVQCRATSEVALVGGPGQMQMRCTCIGRLGGSSPPARAKCARCGRPGGSRWMLCEERATGARDMRVKDGYMRPVNNLTILEKAAGKRSGCLAYSDEGFSSDSSDNSSDLFATVRYRRWGDLTDLEAALQNNQEALALTPEGHPDRAGCLQSLAVSFTDRYQRLGDLTDLEAALQNDQEALALTPEGHPDRAQRLQSLAVSFTDRYQRLGDLTDLEAACRTQISEIGRFDRSRGCPAEHQQALALTPEGHPDRAGPISEIGRFDRSRGCPAEQQEALALTPEGHPDRAGRLQSLAVSFTDRYRRLGDLTDLEAALQNKQEALALTPEGHPDRAGRLQSLATISEIGRFDDLEAALQNKQEALALTPEGHPDRADRLGDLTDLEAALQNVQEALALTPEGHPDRAGRLQSLAVSFTDRYQRLGDLTDLEAALQNDQEALALTPEGHPDHRYQRLGDLTDLEAALQNDQEALALTPEGHPDHAGRLQSLAVSFTDRYQRLGDLTDLEAALQNKQEALALTPEGHPDHAGHRYQRLGDLTDLEAALQNDQEALALTPEGHPARAGRLQSLAVYTSDSVASWKAALRWASLAQEHRPSDCPKAYSAAFGLLPDILWIGNSLLVHQDATRRIDITQTTSDAVTACIDHFNLPLAIELLEQGLATTFKQLLQLKTSGDALLPKADDDQLKLLSSELFSGNSENPQGVAIKRNALIKDIRTRPGFGYFLLPQPYKHLCQASQNGPIIILNSHNDHCDGIILLHPTLDPLHVPLPSVTLHELEQQRSQRSRINTSLWDREGQKSSEQFFEDMLAWLWSHIVVHIYKAMELHGIHDGRLWWCPMETSQLHAECWCSWSNTSWTWWNRSTSGVWQEITKIVSIVGEQNVQSLLGDQATVEAVKLQLQDCSWVHLACHGQQNLHDPPKSCLQLYEGILDLETILRMPLSHAEFVFLAACQTAMGDAELANESFHLGGGFIAAGFRGAIGTMWSMLDQDGPVLAEAIYTHLFSNSKKPQATDAAKALQLAVRKLHDSGVSYERWVPFIHIGV
ncbi:CHAT domain-containing protein [Mycena sp. CBHHK59/15]|nr:CHAT domain-containing protein [Mycena sp. CBHHK59/15]